MARRHRHKHEDHVNHEAWAIPYGDLVTLLLAFFVVMYAMSSVNEGKYRVLSDSLFAAFRGSPRTLEPVQVGEKEVGSGAEIRMTVVQQTQLQGEPREMLDPAPIAISDVLATGSLHSPSNYNAAMQEAGEDDMRQLETLADHIERAMAGLIEDNLIAVRRHRTWVEVEIRTDILFPSGVATFSPDAGSVLEQIAATLKPFPNAVRVEGHTDNVPINTRAFPSNWELSSARAASVVHLFTREGLDPKRLAVIGLAENRPSKGNDTVQGRNANRRVLLVILGGDSTPEGNYGEDRGRPDDVATPPADTEVAPQVPLTMDTARAANAAATPPP